MAFDFLLVGRIILSVISLITIVVMIKARYDGRLGNQFFGIMMLFWSGVIVIAIYPSVLDSVLNNTGFVNRSQFLLSVSIAFIIYLLYYQTQKTKIATGNLNQTIRNIALDYFRRELKNSKTDVVIVIVAKNEEKTIGKVIDEINSQTLTFDYKIIVINDGSTDKTESIAREKGVPVINHYVNIGVGGANKTGYLACRYFDPTIVINIDADGQHDPKYIQKFVSEIKNGSDLVYGTRFSEKSDYNTTSVRLLGNKFYTNLVNRLGKISISDVTSGYRAIKFEKLPEIYYSAETNFAIELALRAAKNSLKISEIPTQTKGREFGKSQFHKIEKFFVYNINALRQIINAYTKNPEMPKMENS